MLQKYLALALLVSSSALACSERASTADHAQPVAQALFNPPGSTTPPAVDFSNRAVGKLKLSGRTCVGTLIHQQYVLGSATKCAIFPHPDDDFSVTFHSSSGTVLATVPIDDVWVQRGDGQRGNFQSEIALFKLSQPVTNITPIPIANLIPADGTAVSSFGYGDFGATSCSTTSDSKKRGLNWTLGAGPYPVCFGDWGAPVLLGNSPGTELLGTILHPGALGNVVRYREAIYEEMLRFQGDRKLTNSQREGVLLSSIGSVTDANSCETKCFENSACAAWNHSGSTCSLLAFPGRWLPSATGTSGLRARVEPGTAIAATPLQTLNNIPGATACAAECAITGGSCLGWTHTSNSGLEDLGVCQLFAVTSPRQAANGNVASGISFVRPNNVALPGGTYSTLTNQTHVGCWAACDAETDCVAFTFYRNTKRCELKDVRPTAVATTNAVSDYKRPYPLYYRIPSGDKLAEFIPAQQLPEACHQACLADPNCIAFNKTGPGFGEELVCRLYSSVTRLNGYGVDGQTHFKFLTWQ